MKGIQAILSHWPLVYLPLFIGFIVMAPHGTMTSVFPIVFFVHGLTILAGLSTTLWFGFDAGRDERLDPTQRLLWILILMMGNLIALPLYYWMRIHPRDGWAEVA